nr:ulp1 protease family, C-terminal catalytic domain-containing protein [Tanacetum cinerariifolium]
MKRKVDNEDRDVRQTQNSKYSESLETPPIKKKVGHPKKSVKANENKSSSVKRRGHPRKSNDEEKKQTIGSKDTETNVLSLTDSSILVTSESMNDILGIPMGGCSIKSLEPRTPDDPFIKEWLSQFREKTEIRPNDISDVIVSTKDAGKLFKMNFLMLFANTMGLCETSGVCNMYILRQIRDDVCVKTIDWMVEDTNVANPSEAANVAQASPTAQGSRAAILHASPIRMTKKAAKRTG